MAIADMFLKMQDVTGEARDAEHKGEIEVTAWSWGVESPVRLNPLTNEALSRRATVHELTIHKKVDRATVTLITFLTTNKKVPTAKLTVRKAGQTPLEYFTAAMQNVRVTSLRHESQSMELVEVVALSFDMVTITYTPQGETGGRGGGNLEVEVANKPMSS